MRSFTCLIAALALLPPLAGCSSQPEPPVPLTKEALAAVAKAPGAPTKELAREVDDLFTKDGLGETRAQETDTRARVTYRTSQSSASIPTT